MNVIQSQVSVTNQSSKYITPYTWESSFDIASSRQWVSSTRNPVMYLAVFYVVTIFSIQSYMKNRPAFKLKNLLTIWNAVLAAISTIAFWRMLPEFYAQLSNGLHESICKWNPHSIVTAYWIYILLLFKIVELGDTMFVVLRKQKLIFLHWYHHVSVLIGSWLSYEMYEPRILWFVTINGGIHAIMYTYYALKAIGVKVPRQCAMMITTIQILQMIMGICVNLYALTMWLAGTGKSKCDVSTLSIQVGFVLYIPFFYLFAKFFYDSYFRKTQSLTKKASANMKSDDRIKKQG